MKLKTALSAIIILGFIGFTKAQNVFVPDLHGKPITETKYINMNGSPYYYDEWLPAEVTLSPREKNNFTQVKFDQSTNKLLFKLDDKIFEFSPQPIAFKINNKGIIKEFVFKNDPDFTKGFYEILYTGNSSLYKEELKTILETKGYNSASTNYTVQSKPKYFATIGKVTQEIKPNSKQIQEKFPHLVNDVNNFEKQHGKIKTEKDLITFMQSL